MAQSLVYNQKRSEEFFEEVLRPYAKDFIVSACVIDLSKKEPVVFGHRMDEFVYPASCYKVFIGAEVLRRIEKGGFSLQTLVEVNSPNDVDNDARIFPEDRRPLLKVGDKESVDHLLDLMLTRSDNTAANCLIDLVSRESVTQNIVQRYGWAGSEVTRKFLDRAKEGEPYRFSETTMSCPRHLAEFFSLVEKNEMVSPFVSEKLKAYMMGRKSTRGFIMTSEDRVDEYSHTQHPSRRHNTRAIAARIFQPPVSFYGKGGWLETNLWEHSPLSALKNIFLGKWAVIRWSHDVGVVRNEDTHFVVCVMSISKSWHPWHRFPIKKVGDAVFDFISASDPVGQCAQVYGKATNQLIRERVDE